MSSYKNENENNVQINPKILSLVYTTLEKLSFYLQSILNMGTMGLRSEE